MADQARSHGSRSYQADAPDPAAGGAGQHRRGRAHDRWR